MILSHRAPSSFNMSSYRAIWTHFRLISTIFEQIYSSICECVCTLDGSGLGCKAATQVREFEKLAFAYFALLSL